MYVVSKLVLEVIPPFTLLSLRLILSTASNGALVTSATPAFVLLFAPFLLSERASKRNWPDHTWNHWRNTLPWNYLNCGRNVFMELCILYPDRVYCFPNFFCSTRCGNIARMVCTRRNNDSVILLGRGSNNDRYYPFKRSELVIPQIFVGRDFKKVLHLNSLNKNILRLERD